MAKVVVREEDFSVSSLLLSPFLFTMERDKGRIISKEDFLILSAWAMFVKDRK